MPASLPGTACDASSAQWWIWSYMPPYPRSASPCRTMLPPTHSIAAVPTTVSVDMKPGMIFTIRLPARLRMPVRVRASDSP